MYKFFVLSFLAVGSILFASDRDLCGTCEKIPLTAPEYIVEDCHPIFFGSLDFTYWIATPGGARTVNGYPTENPAQRGVVTSDFFPPYHGRPGFKIGLGGYLTDVKWEMYSLYTWFSNTNNLGRRKMRTTDTDLYGYQSIGNGYFNRFQSLSLVLRKRFSSGKYISVNPFGGLLAGWDKQWFYEKSDYSFQPSSAATAPGSDGNTNQQWWGIGPYSGFNATLFLPAGFFAPFGQIGFYLDGGAALPYSHYKVQSTYDLYFDQAEDEADDDIQNYEMKFWFFSPMLEASLGLKWITLYGKEHQNVFTLKLGCEQQFWYKHGFFDELSPSVYGNDLLFQGLTLRGKIEY